MRYALMLSALLLLTGCQITGAFFKGYADSAKNNRQPTTCYTNGNVTTCD